MQALSADQLDALVRAAAGDRYHGLWVLLGTAGMRVGAALGTGRDSVDLTAPTLKIQHALQRQRDKALVLGGHDRVVKAVPALHPVRFSAGG
jgi:hypothetical protein